MQRLTYAISRLAVVGAALSLLAAACSPSGDTEAALPTTATPTSSQLVATTVSVSTAIETTTTGLSPPEVGFSADGVDAVVELATDVNSNCLVLIRNGTIVHEQYWNDWDADTDQEVFSTTKSVASVLVGIAQDLGHLDIEQPASDFIDEWVGTDSELVTIRSLLQNTSGREYDFNIDFGDLPAADDQSAFSIALGQNAAPDEQWFYSNSAIQTLETVLERATEQDVEAFATEHLFEPLGMEVELGRDSAGNVGFYAGMDAGCLDLARFMLMVHNGGTSNGRRIVSANYLHDATSARTELNGAYGYLFWLNSDPPWDHTDPRRDRTQRFWPAAPIDMYMASGLGDQVALVLPSLDAVAVRIGSGANQAGFEGVFADEFGARVAAAAQE